MSALGESTFGAVYVTLLNLDYAYSLPRDRRQCHAWRSAKNNCSVHLSSSSIVAVTLSLRSWPHDSSARMYRSQRGSPKDGNPGVGLDFPPSYGRRPCWPHKFPNGRKCEFQCVSCCQNELGVFSFGSQLLASSWSALYVCCVFCHVVELCDGPREPSSSVVGLVTNHFLSCGCLPPAIPESW